MINTVQEANLETDFCHSFLSASSFDEAWDHYITAQGLALLDTNDLCEIADFLSNKGKKWKYAKTNKGRIIESILLNTRSNQLADCLNQLMSSGKIEPSVIQQRRSVVGPLGVAYSVQSRTYSTSDDLIQFIQVHFNEQHFGEFGKQSGSPLLVSQSEIPTNPTIRSLAYIQLILTNYQDAQILREFNTLICQNLLELNDIEKYWTLIASPCGVVQKAYEAEGKLTLIIRKYYSNEELAELLKSKAYQNTDLETGLQELCLSESPEQLLQELFGRKELHQIAKECGLVAVEKVRDTSELVKIIALCLGFALPPALEGIKTHIVGLENRRLRLEQHRINAAERDGLVSESFVSVEKILKELANFYMCLIWPDTIEPYFELHEKKKAFNDLVRREFRVGKKEGLNRLMLGELIQVIRKLNERVLNDELLKQRSIDILEREELIPNYLLDTIEVACSYRRHFVHDTLGVKRNNIITTVLCQKILTDIINFAKAVADDRVYPCVITIKKEVTDEYGRTYVEAIDESGKNWTIKSRAWLRPEFAYYMLAPKYGLIAIDPFIIEKLG